MADANRLQARSAVNVEVRFGRMPRPDSLACADCGLPAAEYDHHLGYAPEHHLSVEPVCRGCHASRDNPKKNQTHCLRGHEFTAENTHTRKNGTRHCRACRREYDRTRVRRPGYWREVNARRKEKNYGKN